MSLVGPQSLHPAQHPVVVFALLGLAHVIGCPALVPGAPLLPLPGADQRVGLEGEQQLRSRLAISFSLSYLLSFVERVPLVDVVLAVDDPQYLVVGVDDAAGVVCLLPWREDGGVRQVELVVSCQTRPGESEVRN